MILSAMQNPAPSLKDRPAQTQPLGGTGSVAGSGTNIGGSSEAVGGDGAGWAWAAENSSALIKIVLASIVIIIAAPSHYNQRDYRIHHVQDAMVYLSDKFSDGPQPMLPALRASGR
jgi:hypothetical protein